MAIITISRGSKSGGTQLAEMVAKRLGTECVSREILIEAAANYGFEENLLADIMERPPRLWERLTPRRKMYMRFVSAVLHSHAGSGNLVYHGHAGHFLLKDIVCVLRVKLITPLEQRIKLVMESQGISRSEAHVYLKATDETRARWTKFLYGVDWNDPALYDIVINLEKITLQTACELICKAAEHQPFRVDEDGLVNIKNRGLEACIIAALSCDLRTQTLDIEPEADGDTVKLKGNIEVESIRPIVLQIVRGVIGVKNVYDELTVRKLSLTPT